jgi:hypothetical protein
MNTARYRCVIFLKPERPGHVPTRVEPQPSREAAMKLARGRLPSGAIGVDVERAVAVKGDERHVHWRLQARRRTGRELQEIRIV